MAIRSVFFYFLIFAVGACAHNKYSDRDRTNPGYYEGSGIAVTDSASISGLQKNSNQLPPPNNGGKGATEGLIESAVSLAAYPDYYKPSTIRGTCLLNVETSLARVPCRHMHVLLLSGEGQSVGSTETNENGQFAFYVKKEKIYFLTLDNPKFKISEEDRKPLTMGADVTLHALRVN